MRERFDIVIAGAGIAGASLAAELARHRSVLVIEAEDQPGYHSTGRSAAFWSESYGGPFVQPLTTASGTFLREQGFLRRRGALHIADASGKAALEALRENLGGLVALEALDGEVVTGLVPTLGTEWRHALYEESCADIDVAALHAFYLALARRGGARLVAGEAVTAIERVGDRWNVRTAHRQVEAQLVVNAAGAWADEVAALAGLPPLGLQPYRRTLVQLRVDPPADADLPLVIDAAGSFYFKPEAGGRLWLSPHDESPCDPCDCAPEEIDVALAIDRLERATTWKVERVERSWAGLRTFAPDRRPVYGFDPLGEGFFWCAGQGGFGIQTAPAAARLAAALVLGREPDLDAAPYSPSRFRN